MSFPRIFKTPKLFKNYAGQWRWPFLHLFFVTYLHIYIYIQILSAVRILLALCGKNVKIYCAMSALLKLCANINFYIIFCNRILKSSSKVGNWFFWIIFRSFVHSNLLFTYIMQFLGFHLVFSCVKAQIFIYIFCQSALLTKSSLWKN